MSKDLSNGKDLHNLPNTPAVGVFLTTWEISLLLSGLENKINLNSKVNRVLIMELSEKLEEAKVSL